MLFRDYRHHPQGLADLLPYALLPDAGVMQLKDGALQAAWFYAGPDLGSSSYEQLAVLSAQINAPLAQLGDGYMIHTDAFRRPSRDYLEASQFPFRTPWAIEVERARQYRALGQHYETVQTLALTYLPPSTVTRQVTGLMSTSSGGGEESWEQQLAAFTRTADSFEDVLSARLSLARMGSEELLSYLHSCITGLLHPVAVPHIPAYLDVILGGQDLVVDSPLRIGQLYLQPIGLMGFPLESYPEIMSFLTRLPAEFRWSHRFIFCDPTTAQRHLARYRREWFTGGERPQDLVATALNVGHRDWRNRDADRQALDADEALAEASSGEVRYGFYTCGLLVFHEDRTIVDRVAREVCKELQQHGFPARIETTNALEAYLGSLPGHGTPNIRKPLINTLNLADFLPLTSVWPGLETNPCPYYPPDSPPVFYAATSGAVPFRFHLHVQDTGHCLLLGPTGSGKSTFVGLTVAQFWRYPNAQVFCFDMGYSSYVLTKACGGDHYDIAGKEETLGFCPLAGVDDPEERLWAQEWLEQLLVLQGVQLNPGQRKALSHALELLGAAPSRTLTDLVSTVQDHTIRDGLHHYTLAGGLGTLLDAEHDSLSSGRFQVFELSHLYQLGEKNLVPVFSYLTHRVEQRANGDPMLIVMEEAWIMALHSVIAAKIEEWLRTMRKRNAAVLFVSRSLADVANSPQRDMLLTSCPTKVLLPHSEATSEQTRELYYALGLNDREIQTIATALPKREYYYTSPLGRRVIDLNIGPLALSFIGVDGQRDRQQVDACIATYGPTWPAEWLRRRGLPEEAELWLSDQ